MRAEGMDMAMEVEVVVVAGTEPVLWVVKFPSEKPVAELLQEYLAAKYVERYSRVNKIVKEVNLRRC